MTDEARERNLRAIAHLATEVRKATGATPWNYQAILAALHRGVAAEKPVYEVARAALWFAHHRTKQDTPLMLSEDGRHWHADQEQAGDPSVVLPPPWKPPPPPANPLTPERLREIRQQAHQQATRKDH